MHYRRIRKCMAFICAFIMTLSQPIGAWAADSDVLLTGTGQAEESLLVSGSDDVIILEDALEISQTENTIVGDEGIVVEDDSIVIVDESISGNEAKNSIVLLEDSSVTEEVLLDQEGDSSTENMTLTIANGSCSSTADTEYVEVSNCEGYAYATIKQAGTYTLTGTGSNFYLTVEKGISGVVIILNSLTVDNSGLNTATSGDYPVMDLGSATSVTMILNENSVISGADSFTEEPAAIISQKGGGSLTINGSGSLTINDSMSESTSYIDADSNEVDPSVGIQSKKGTVTFQSGTVNIDVNGEGVKTASGSVLIEGGTLNINESGGDGIKAKEGTVTVNDGTLNIVTRDDGIQSEQIIINGGDVDITTTFDNASTQYYTSGTSSSTLNTISESNNTKTELVRVDTGSHKALKAGTKGKTYYYGYTIDNDNSSSLTEAYSESASGGITITGGTIDLNTIGCGIKANAASGYTATASGVYIIGSPDDAIYSNNTLDISGGTITINSGDDGISAAGTINITDGTINIEEAFEGIEGQTINIGKANSSSGPEITINSNDDGTNSTYKTVTYYYESEDNEDTDYKKVSVSTSSGNNTNIYSGTLKIYIDSANGKSTTLAGSTVSYSASGDGIDCNGSLYIYGGETYVYGESSGSNSPIDRNDSFYLYKEATLLAAGQDGMNESVPSNGDGAYVKYGGNGNSGAPGSGAPGSGTPDFGGSFPNGNSMTYSSDFSELGNDGFPGGGGSSNISANSSFMVKQSGTTIYSGILPYACSFVLYSSPDITSGSSYTLTIGSTSTSVTAACGSSESSELDDIDVTGITLDQTSVTVDITKTADITATVVPSDATDQSISWSVDDENIITLSSYTSNSGDAITVIPAGTGTAIVTATSGTVTATCSVTVEEEEEEEETETSVSVNSIDIIYDDLSVSTSGVSLKKGTAISLEADITPEDAGDTSVTWSSDDEKIATVSDSGYVVGEKAGETVIRATANDGSGVYGQCTVNVYVPITRATINSTSISLNVDGTYTLKVTTTPSDATNVSTTFESSDTSVAVVDVATGLVKAVSGGSAIIKGTVTSDGNITKTVKCKVTVKENEISVTRVKLDKSVLKLGVGNEYTINATVYPLGTTDTALTWTSDNEECVTVTADDEDTSVATVKVLQSAKRVRITATSANGKKAVCSVLSGEAITALDISTDSVDLAVGKTYKLNTVCTPSDAYNRKVEWSSSDTNIATVTSGGSVKAVSAGTATITATTTDGSNLSASCTVNTYYAITKLKLNCTKFITGYKSDTTSLTATATLSSKGVIDVTDRTAEDYPYHYVEWSSNKPEIATVDSEGKVTPIACGVARITAKNTVTGKKSTCTVIVRSNVTGITLKKTSATVKAGRSTVIKYTLSCDPENKAIADSSVTYKSLNEDIATVTQKGRVTVSKTATTGEYTYIVVTTNDGGYKKYFKIMVG
ncbi:MAG: Ig-like domain-containing protein [Lachnospiraceae bacterium]|nr:Ig-like domain-containing protein [Lachnospiraceae bacterium]